MDQSDWLVMTCDKKQEALDHRAKFQFELANFTIYEVSDEWQPTQRLNPDLTDLKKVSMEAEAPKAQVDVATLTARAKDRAARIAALQASVAATHDRIATCALTEIEASTASRTKKISQLQAAIQQQDARLAKLEQSVGVTPPAAVSSSSSSAVPSSSKKTSASAPVAQEEMKVNVPSDLVVIKNGVLRCVAARWDGVTVSSLSDEQRGLVVESVETCMESGVGISQGVHDKYIVVCLSTERDVRHISGTDWQQSLLLKLEAGTLRWSAAKDFDFKGARTEEVALFVKEVEFAIRQKAAHVSQGLHDQYVRHCITTGRPVMEVGVSVGTDAERQAKQYALDNPKTAEQPAPTHKDKKDAQPKSKDTQLKKLTTKEHTRLAKAKATGNSSSNSSKQQASSSNSSGNNSGSSSVRPPANGLDFEMVANESFTGFCSRHSQAGAGAQSGGASEEEIQQHFSEKADQQMAKVNALMQAIEKEMARQMADKTEIQRLQIANTTLRTKNSKMRRLLQ